MEDNRKFATFFADAPKGKKIGAVLSWIATVILMRKESCNYAGTNGKKKPRTCTKG